MRPLWTQTFHTSVSTPLDYVSKGYVDTVRANPVQVIFIFHLFHFQVDVLCNDELLGKDHTLKFVCMTRWRFKVSLKPFSI